MIQEIIKEIVTAEKTAEEMIKIAHINAKEFALKAKNDSADIRALVNKSVSEVLEKSKKESQIEADVICEKIKQNAEIDAQEIAEKVLNKKDTLSNIILDRMVEKYAHC